MMSAQDKLLIDNRSETNYRILNQNKRKQLSECKLFIMNFCYMITKEHLDRYDDDPSASCWSMFFCETRNDRISANIHSKAQVALKQIINSGHRLAIATLLNDGQRVKDYLATILTTQELEQVHIEYGRVEYEESLCEGPNNKIPHIHKIIKECKAKHIKEIFYYDRKVCVEALSEFHTKSEVFNKVSAITGVAVDGKTNYFEHVIQASKQKQENETSKLMENYQYGYSKDYIIHHIIAKPFQSSSPLDSLEEDVDDISTTSEDEPLDSIFQNRK